MDDGATDACNVLSASSAETTRVPCTALKLLECLRAIVMRFTVLLSNAHEPHVTQKKVQMVLMSRMTCHVQRIEVLGRPCGIKILLHGV